MIVNLSSSDIWILNNLVLWNMIVLFIIFVYFSLSLIFACINFYSRVKDSREKTRILREHSAKLQDIAKKRNPNPIDYIKGRV